MSLLPAIVLVGTLIAIPTRPPISYADTLWLARAVQGEVGVMGEHRAETGSWIVHVALNREASKWFPDNVEWAVRQGFAGAHMVDEPEPWAWDIVEDALFQRQSEDPTGGALFIFGGLDINSCMDWSSHRGSAYRKGWVFSVHMFARWPYIKNCVP